MTSDPLKFKLVAFFPADHAETVNGKLYINGGGWQRLNFPSYPQVLPGIALVAIVEVPFARFNAEHTFAIGMEDPDGNPMTFKAEGKFRVGADAQLEFGQATVMPIAIPVYNLFVERAGDFSFTLSIDGEELGRYQFTALQMPVLQQFHMGPPQTPESEAS